MSGIDADAGDTDLSRRSRLACARWSCRSIVASRRSIRSGVPTTLSRYAGTIHGFFVMHPFLDVGRRAHEEAELRAALHESP